MQHCLDLSQQRLIKRSTGHIPEIKALSGANLRPTIAAAHPIATSLAALRVSP